MKIAICASMAFAKEMVETKKALGKLGHVAVISDFSENFIGKTEAEKVKLNEAFVAKHDAIREFWKKIKKSEAILVLNYDRHGIKNYIGGNTLMEIGFAHVLGKKIFLLNPIPEIPFYKAEIEGIKPVIVNGDLANIC